MNKISIIAGAATFIVSMLGFFVAVRTELKKNTQQIVASKLDDEKRHALHERRLSVIEQKLQISELAIAQRLDDINQRIGQLYEIFLEHLKEKR